MRHENPPAKPLTILGAAVLVLLVSTAPAQAAPWIGILMGDGNGGVSVTRVMPTSPAATAGLKKGDVLTFVNGQPVRSPKAVVAITGKSSPGQTLYLTIKRGGNVFNKQLKVGTVPDMRTLLRLFWLNQPSPNFTTPMINRSGSLQLSSLKGKAVIVYFWASWCDSCKLNFTKLKRLHAAYAKRGLVIYSLSQDKKVSKTKQTLTKLQLPFPVGHNYKNRIGLIYKSNKIPTLIAIDRQGIIRDFLRGSSFGYAKLDKLVRKLL
ncbi:MAG: redoxin domain-containing protein [bacterium]